MQAATADEPLPEDDYPGGQSTDAGFAAFYRIEFIRVVALARSLCGSWAVAEELAQDAFLVAHRKWNKVGGLDDPGQWVRRVAVNRARSSYRRGQAERRALKRAGSGTAVEELPVQVEGLLDQIADLPAKQAQAIAAVYVAQLSVREAAAVVGCSESTLRTHLQRGRGALRKIYLKTEHQR